MLSRSASLTHPAPCLGVLALLLIAAGDARAHRLEAKWRVLAGLKVQVSARYKTIPRSMPAPNAEVRVVRPNGQLLIKGKTDARGWFVFSFQKAEMLRVRVYQEGHLAKTQIDAAALRKALEAQPQRSADAQPEADRRESAPRLTVAEEPDNSADQEEDFDEETDWQGMIKDGVVGVGFLLALAAFVLSLRNARQLRELGQKSQPPANSDQPR